MLVILNIKLLILIEIFQAGEDDNSPQNIVVYIYCVFYWSTPIKYFYFKTITSADQIDESEHFGETQFALCLRTRALKTSHGSRAP